MRSKACREYDRRINDEIAAGQQHDPLIVRQFQQCFITPAVKKRLQMDPHVPYTFYDLIRDAVEVLPKLRFIYLLSLLEAFGCDYVAERERIPTETVRTTIAPQVKEWESRPATDRFLRSTSLLNLGFLRFVLIERYKVDFRDATIHESFWEAGELRRCLIHHGGVIATEDHRLSLRSTIRACGVVDTVGSKLHITPDQLWVYINSAREFLKRCDY